MECPDWCRDCVVDFGAGVAKGKARLERLDLFVDGDSRAGLFHVSQTVDGKSVRGEGMKEVQRATNQNVSRIKIAEIAARLVETTQSCIRARRAARAYGMRVKVTIA